MTRAYATIADGGVVSRPARLSSRKGKYHLSVRVQRDVMFHPPGGTGELSGHYPSSSTTVEGVPVSALVLVRYRADEPGGKGDGALVAVVQSNAAGEWSAQGLNGRLRYDVFARLAGENDALQSSVRPFDEARFVPSEVSVTMGRPLDVPLPRVGGAGDLTATIASGALPSGVTLVGQRLQGVWPTGAIGAYPVVFDVFDGAVTVAATLTLNLALLPMSLVAVGMPALAPGGPVAAQFTASGGEGPYTYSVSAGALPAGLTLNSATGALTGTPASGGVYAFTITATDVRSGTASLPFSGEMATPHSYWRINITAANSHAALSELEFAAMAGGTNLCVGGSPVTGGSWPPPGYAAANAFDGNTSSNMNYSWASSVSSSGWIGYHFASPVVVKEARISARSQSSQYPTAFSVDYSDDGVTWTQVVSYSGQTSWPYETLKAFAVP